jgi:hypothetical protein
MSEDDIANRISQLSPEAWTLFWEVYRKGEETDFEIPPEELLVGDELARLAELPREEQVKFFGVFGAMAREDHQEVYRLKAEGVRAEGFMQIIARAQELDRKAGRPVNENMTLEEAVPKLEEAGELDTLEREYLRSVWGEIVWVPVEDEEE